MFLDLLRERRSIRKYLLQPVEKEKIAALVEAALRSPSSRGINPWQFIVLDDGNLLETLAASKQHGSSFLKGAPLAIIVCADPSAETWVEDCSIASIFIQLAAESLGLKSCWIQIRGRKHDAATEARDFIAQQVNLPANLAIEAIIAAGYPAEAKPPHQQESLQYEKVWLNAHGQPWR